MKNQFVKENILKELHMEHQELHIRNKYQMIMNNKEDIEEVEMKEININNGNRKHRILRILIFLLIVRQLLLINKHNNIRMKIIWEEADLFFHNLHFFLDIVH
jgi:hypothetical protein